MYMVIVNHLTLNKTFISYLVGCCCKSISDMKSYFISKDKQFMVQIMMLNNSNTKLCKAVENMDKKIVSIMKADSRIRAMAVPLPNIPPAFIGILPVKTMDELKTVETLLSDGNEEANKYKEELVIDNYYLNINIADIKQKLFLRFKKLLNYI